MAGFDTDCWAAAWCNGGPMTETQKAKGAKETMIARSRNVGKRIGLIGVLLSVVAVASAEEPARIGNVKFLRDGKVEKICFEYTGTLRYREFQFPRAKYGYLDFEPAVLDTSKLRFKPLSDLVHTATMRVMGEREQRVRLDYQLSHWAAPSFHDTGSRMEIRFVPTPSIPVPADAAIPPLAGGMFAAAASQMNDPPPSLIEGLDDDIFADYLKLNTQSPSVIPAPPAPPELTALASTTGDSVAPLVPAQGGEGAPPAAAPEEKAALTVITGDKSGAFVPEDVSGTVTDQMTGARGWEFVDLEEEIFQKQISLTFKDAELQNAIRILSRHAELNVVMDPRDVGGKLTVELNQVPVGAALASILRTNKLELIRESGGIYRVVPSNMVRRERQIEEITVHIPLNWVSAAEVKTILDPIVDGDITADTMGNSLILTDTPLKIEEIAHVIKRMDKPEKQVTLEARLVEMNTNLTRALGINWDLTRLDRDVAHEALNLPKSVTDIIDTIPSVPVVIGYDPISGAPILHTPPGTDVTQAMSSFLTNPLSRAPAAIQAGAGGGADTLGVFTPNTTLPGGMSWAWGTDVSVFGNQYQLSTLLEAAELANLAKTLVAPRVVTINNQPATIDIIRKVPYSSTVIGAGGAQSVTFDYEDVGIQMTITPNITNNDYVRMNIQPTQRILISQVGSSRPTIDERRSQTNVIVKDEDTAVIAGLRQQEFAETMSGVPWFNKIPVLGWAFKGKDYRNNKTDLLAMVTPHIIKEEQILTEQEKFRYDEIDVQWDLPDYFFDDVKIDLSE